MPEEPEEIKIRDNGGMHLCSLEMQCWGIVYTVAIEWRALVIFQWKRPFEPGGDSFINFYVPKDATFFYEICAFIGEHLKKLQYDPMETESGRRVGGMQCNLYKSIYKFGGAQPEITVAQSEAMIKEWSKDIMLDLGAPKRRERVELQAMERLNADPEFAKKLLGSMLPSRLEKLMGGEE